MFSYGFRKKKTNKYFGSSTRSSDAIVDKAFDFSGFVFPLPAAIPVPLF